MVVGEFAVIPGRKTEWSWEGEMRRGGGEKYGEWEYKNDGKFNQH